MKTSSYITIAIALLFATTPLRYYDLTTAFWVSNVAAFATVLLLCWKHPADTWKIVLSFSTSIAGLTAIIGMTEGVGVGFMDVTVFMPLSCLCAGVAFSLRGMASKIAAIACLASVCITYMSLVRPIWVSYIS